MAYVNLGQVVWPIGAIYMSSSSTSPASLFGGTWEQFTDSKMWLPQNNYGTTGGELNHVLTVNIRTLYTQTITLHFGNMAQIGVEVMLGVLIPLLPR